MPDKTIEIVIEGQDKLSGPAKTAAASLNTLAQHAQASTNRINGFSGAAAHATETVGMFSIGLKGMLMVSAGMAAYTGITQAVQSLGSAMISTNATLETASIQFKVLLGSTEAASSRVKELYDFAAKTPFTFPEVLAASKLLQTFGGSALATGDNLRLVGDMAAYANVSFSEIATWVGRAYTAMSAGRPFGEAAQRLQELGLISGDVRNKLEDMQKAGAKGAEMWKVFTAAMDPFKGMMDELSLSFTGLLSTLGDNINMAMGKLGKPLFDAIKSGMQPAIDFIGGPVTSAFTNFAQLLTSMPTNPFIQNVAAAATGALGFAVALRSAQTAMSLFGAVLGWLPGLFTPLGLAMAAFGGLAVAWVNNVGGMQNAVQAFDPYIIDLGNIMSAFNATVGQGGPGAVGAFIAALEGAKGPISTFVSWVSQALQAMGNIAQYGLFPAYGMAQETARAMESGAQEAAGIVTRVNAAARAVFDKTAAAIKQATAAAKAAQAMAMPAPALSFGGGGGGGGGGKAAKEVKDLADYMREAGITAQSMAQAMVNAHPAVQVLTLRITGLKDQLAAVNASIAANEAAQAAMQGAIEQTQNVIRALSDRLSEAKQRLSDLNNIQLTGMGAADDQIFAVEQAIKRLQYVAAGGVLGPDMMPDARQLQWLAGLPTDLEGLQRALERIRAGKELTFDPQMRQLREALTPGREMPLSRALAEITRTKAEIRGLEAQLASANETLVAQQAALKELQTAHANLQASASQLQLQISQAEQMQQSMTQAMMKAILWMIDERGKMENLGDESVLQAGIVDEKTKAMLDAFMAFSAGHVNIGLTDIERLVRQWQWARDEIDRIMAGAPSLPSPPTVPYTPPPTEGTPSTRSFAYSMARGGGNSAVNVTVNVAGNVTTESDLAESIRTHLLKTSRRNGGLLWS